MERKEYINTLKGVNFFSNQSFSDFRNGTISTGPDARNTTGSITLGSEMEYTYELSILYLMNRCSWSPRRPRDPADVAMIGATDPKVHFQVRFIYPLGKLRKLYFGGAVCDWFRYTGYIVGMDIFDRSIWLIYPAYCETTIFEDTWRLLGTQASGRPPFDVMRLMSWEEFESIALDQESARVRPMFSAEAVATSRRIQPKPSHANVTTIVQVIRHQMLEQGAEFRRRMLEEMSTQKTRPQTGHN
ncbi:MAG: hypothetical protein Q9208_002791 [Pyrenodesmia sp. 3 TL-2023]